MKYLLLLLISGCAGSAPMFDSNGTAEQKMVLDKNIQAMSRNEVIIAINECEANRTRAVVIMAKQKISGRTTDVVTDVTCAPKYYY